jgi:hypothetical protein
MCIIGCVELVTQFCSPISPCGFSVLQLFNIEELMGLRPHLLFWLGKAGSGHYWALDPMRTIIEHPVTSVANVLHSHRGSWIASIGEAWSKHTCVSAHLIIE